MDEDNIEEYDEELEDDFEADEDLDEDAEDADDDGSIVEEVEVEVEEEEEAKPVFNEPRRAQNQIYTFRATLASRLNDPKVKAELDRLDIEDPTEALIRRNEISDEVRANLSRHANNELKLSKTWWSKKNPVAWSELKDEINDLVSNLSIEEKQQVDVIDQLAKQVLAERLSGGSYSYDDAINIMRGDIQKATKQPKAAVTETKKVVKVINNTKPAPVKKIAEPSKKVSVPSGKRVSASKPVQRDTFADILAKNYPELGKEGAAKIATDTRNAEKIYRGSDRRGN